jgi:hypothetical protein
MYEANPRLFEPAVVDGRPSPRHLTRKADLELSRAAAERVARANGAGASWPGSGALTRRVKAPCQ